MQVSAAAFSPIIDAQFRGVFGQSLWIIVGSVIAFALSQLVDVFIFWLVPHKTGGRYLWMGATGSTVISQLIDSIVIIGIAFWLPGKVRTSGSSPSRPPTIPLTGSSPSAPRHCSMPAMPPSTAT